VAGDWLAKVPVKWLIITRRANLLCADSLPHADTHENIKIKLKLEIVTT